jgi:hypothetical protein
VPVLAVPLILVVVPVLPPYQLQEVLSVAAALVAVFPTRVVPVLPE